MADSIENNEREDSSYEFLKSMMEIGDKNKTFENFFGAEQSVSMLKECIVLPLRFPQLFQGLRSLYLRSFMIFGAPGCGKSHLLYAAANAAEIKLFLFNVWNLQSTHFRAELSPEECIETVFKVVDKNAPCILCLEDLEVLSKKKSHFEKGRITLIHKLNEELNKSRAQNVLVIGVTQKPWDVDLYLKRMFVRKTGSYVRLCKKGERIQFLKTLIADMSNNLLLEEDYEQIAKKTKGFTGSDIHCLVQTAAMKSLRRLMEVTHFKKVTIQTFNVTPQNDDSKPIASDTSNEDCDHGKDGQSENQIEKPKAIEKFMPCKPGDDGAISMSIYDIPEDKICVEDYHKIDLKSFQEVLVEKKPSVPEEELTKYKDFAFL